MFYCRQVANRAYADMFRLLRGDFEVALMERKPRQYLIFVLYYIDEMDTSDG